MKSPATKEGFNRINRPILVNEIFVYVLFAALIIVAAAVKFDSFFTTNNFLIITKQTAETALVAYAMTFVITAGEIDLSIGAVAALTSMVASLSMRAGLDPITSSILGLLVGVCFGLTNGILIAKLKLVSFLVTLGTMSIASGIALTVTQQAPVTLYDQNFIDAWGRAKFVGIPIGIFWALGFFLLFMFIYRFTPFGNHVKATGGNRTAARFSGIKTDDVIIKVMLISGICASIAGLLFTSRLSQGRPDIGSTLPLDAITAVVLGGTPFTGGKGSVATSLVGAFVLITLTNALVIMGVPSTIQIVVKGIVVILAVTLSTRNIVIGSRKKQSAGEG